jgi:hypothetical protein
MTLILSNAAATLVAKVPLDSVLPGAFGPQDLGINIAEYQHTGAVAPPAATSPTGEASA